MSLVMQRIRAEAGMTQVVNLPLEPSPAQVGLLAGYCGTTGTA